MTFEQFIGVSRYMEESLADDPFSEKIVHFDLKGAPLKIGYYAKVFPLLKQLGVSAVLMEYEDMFPYWDSIALLKRSIGYSPGDIAAIIKLADENQLEVIPLVQTFGHMEFVLKFNKFSHLREDPAHMDTICPSSNESCALITEMLKQVRLLHPKSRRIHIGADEAWQIAKDDRCLERLRSDLSFSTDNLKLSHISSVARVAGEELGFEEVLAWNDMFGAMNADLLKRYELGRLLTPVVWGYATDVTLPGYFPLGMFERFSQVFNKMMFASAFKGANGMRAAFISVNRYLSNQASYVDLYRRNETLKGRVKGIILTGWQRYSHLAPLCELFPVGLPSLVFDIVYLNNTAFTTEQLVENTQKILGCPSEKPVPAPLTVGTETFFPSLETAFVNCSFPGHDVFDLVESLRFLTWRVHRSANAEKAVLHKVSLNLEISSAESKIREVFQRYFYDETIDEFIATTVEPLRSFL